MASSISSSADYCEVSPSAKASRPSEFWKGASSKHARSTKVSWRAPWTILIAFHIGLGFALAHHFMGVSLNNKSIAHVEISQAWIFRFGTALAFLVKLALATSVGTAYTQHQWQRFHEQSFRTNEIDALTSVLANAFSFLSSAVWLEHPVLALMALVSWGIPLAAIIAPGSLTVSPQSNHETLSLQVRQPDSNYTNFGTFTGGDSGLLLGYPRLYSLAYRTASTGMPISLDSPGHHQNASYHLNFNGPAIKCASANGTYIDDLTYRYGAKPYIRDKTLFLSWIGQRLPALDSFDRPVEALDRNSDDGARISVMTNEGIWNVSRTYNETANQTYETPYRQVNVTECVLFNATYSVDYHFAYPDQTREASVSRWLNPVAMLPRLGKTGYYNGNTTDHHIMSYGTVMDAFGQMLLGEAKEDRYNTQRVTSTIWKLVPIDWKDGQAVGKGLEALFQNITLSLLSDDALIKNGSSADFVPVNVTTWPVTYVYTASDLLLAYGVALLCALSCSAVGLYAFYANNTSYQNLFSTYLRATNDLDIRSQKEAGDDGADLLPKALARSQVAIGGRWNASDTATERKEGDEVELQRLSLDETNPSLGLDWSSSTNSAHGPVLPPDDRTWADQTGEHLPAECDASSPIPESYQPIRSNTQSHTTAVGENTRSD